MSKIITAPWKVNRNEDLQQKYEQDFGSAENKYRKSNKNLKTLIKKLDLLVFIVSIAAFTFLIFFKPPLPERDEILDKIIFQDPFQNSQVIDEQFITKGDYRYKIYPQFSYELFGLVVSEYDSENVLDVMHKEDPAQIKDLCVVWGDNILSGIYKDLEYKSGEFTCYAKPKKGGDWSAFSGEHLSNNHLVPASDRVAEKIRKANVGDQIHIKGFLSRYEVYDKKGDLISTRATSIRRDDGGNGACETIYTTEFEILKGRNYLFKLARNITGVVSVITFIGLFVLVLFL